MRRIAAVALTAGTLMAGMAAVGTPAEAATSWAPYNSYSNISAWGTYSRSGGSTYVKGYLRDSAKNGWTACVRFLFTEGSKQYWSRHKIIATTSSGSTYNFDGKGTVAISAKSSYSSHLWVQECGRNKKTGKYLYGKGKKLF
ncbi:MULTISPECIES: hypothetical protein [Actinomadura]|uniref:Uncharacterized protein n=2 Tax=Actinomadura TaxID=1988 RepID=A0A5D0UHV7_9ACTN|nr:MULTISPECIES: hypothetical protein [Actinomadura]TYC17242.1 hypothetical protein FXF65_04240 [Actinomadura syzygii]TYK53002.1 hypothetical protein FXF68_04470 [Actinomadura decatromicini]